MERFQQIINGKVSNIEFLEEEKMTKDLSIIIATFNESKNIRKLIQEVELIIKKMSIKSFEIIIIDDNSPDGSFEILKEISKKDKNFISLIRKTDRGIFSAIKDGIKISRGEKILTMDADFSHPPEKIPELLKYSKDYDIVSGSRFVKGGNMESPFIRKIGSKFLNRICGLIMDLNIKDLGGNFRVFDREKFESLDLKYPSVFGEFGFEIFYRAKKKDYKIKEVPFTYKFRKEGKSKMGNLTKYGLAYINRAFQLRFESILFLKKTIRLYV